MLSSLQKSTVHFWLSIRLGHSCILGPFASHHRLLQDIPRDKCLDPGAGSEVQPSQGRAAEVRDKLCLTPWAGHSFPVCGVYWEDWELQGALHAISQSQTKHGMAETPPVQGDPCRPTWPSAAVLVAPASSPRCARVGKRPRGAVHPPHRLEQQITPWGGWAPTRRHPWLCLLPAGHGGGTGGREQAPGRRGNSASHPVSLSCPSQNSSVVLQPLVCSVN